MQLIYTEEDMKRNEARFIKAVEDGMGMDDRGASLLFVGKRIAILGGEEISRIKQKLTGDGTLTMHEDRDKTGQGRKPTFIKLTGDL